MHTYFVLHAKTNSPKKANKSSLCKLGILKIKCKIPNPSHPRRVLGADYQTRSLQEIRNSQPQWLCGCGPLYYYSQWL